MEQNIASTRTLAWVKRIARPIRTQVNRAEEPDRFGRGTRSRADMGTSPAAAVSPDAISNSGMVLLARTQRPAAATQRREAAEPGQGSQRTASEGATSEEAEPEEVDREELADKVYRLMRDELILERERGARPRGRPGG